MRPVCPAPVRWSLWIGLLLALWPVTTLYAQDAPDATAVALDRRFTYQGRLDSGGVPVNGNCDLRFRLYDAASGGAQIGGQQTSANITVSDGLFVVALNASDQFGPTAFNGDRRWLEIDVRCPAGGGGYTTLAPRQPLNPAPYAIHALSAGSVPWSGVTGAPVYSAGTGLQLVGSQFRVLFGGNGSATTVARSDHNHFGQTWSGAVDAPALHIINTLNSGEAIALVLDSAGTIGLGVRSQFWGVYSQITGTTGYPIYGVGGSYGVHGEGFNGVSGISKALVPGATNGVYGEARSTQGRGVFGTVSHPTGVTAGVYGESVSSSGRGIFGTATHPTGTTYGVFGQAASSSGRAVYGRASSGSGMTYGVFGRADSVSGRGVYGVATAVSGTNYGIYGQTNSANGFAGYFSGRVQVVGTFSSSNKYFLIDHPLDPANKVLRHASVESSEMLNLYSGNVTLDGNGEAVVTVPDWFSALNTDIRYQLTAIGAPAPTLYIAEKLTGNRFRIGGGAAGQEVSWQLTGVRHDPTARYLPLIVEEDKHGEERGRYLLPAAYGQPRELGVTYQLDEADTE